MFIFILYHFILLLSVYNLICRNMVLLSGGLSTWQMKTSFQQVKHRQRRDAVSSLLHSSTDLLLFFSYLPLLLQRSIPMVSSEYPTENFRRCFQNVSNVPIVNITLNNINDNKINVCLRFKLRGGFRFFWFRSRTISITFT